MTLQNFRDASEKLNTIIGEVRQIGPDLKESGANIRELTETVKSQPWRLIWPSTKKPEPVPEGAVPVRKMPKRPRQLEPTPPPRTR